jgi:thiamine biosynthesis lipoprotein
MGADARIVLCGIEREAAAAAVAAAVDEIERLEQSLSLFRENSEICRLNREGALKSASGDLLRAFRLAVAVAADTNGLFDPSVQTLWEAYVDWFAARPKAGMPPAAIIATARTRVDWRGIHVGSDEIRLDPGHRVTLNGLGQGYVTDRVADLLQGRGLTHTLVDLGEQRALGTRDDGTPWEIARENSSPILLSSGALATSEGAGCILGADGEAHHLFDPASGLSAHHWRRVSVHHQSAAIADALSTALYIASPNRMPAVLRRVGGLTVWATDRAGREFRMSSPDG